MSLHFHNFLWIPIKCTWLGPIFAKILMCEYEPSTKDFSGGIYFAIFWRSNTNAFKIVMSPHKDLNYFVFILAKLYCEMRHANYLDLCVSIFEGKKVCGKIRAQSFTSLMADLCQDLNRFSSFSKNIIVTFPWRNWSVKALLHY